MGEVVTIMWVANPGPLILTNEHYSRKQTSTFSCPLWKACPWRPAIAPDPDYRPRPGATATAIQK